MQLSLHTLLFMGASVLTWSPAEARVRPRATHDVVKRELSYYEERYINTLDFKLPNNTVKLVGCKKMRVPSHQVDEFEDHYLEHYDAYQGFESHFYDEASMELRIYFPVNSALVEHSGTMIEASDLGEFELDSIDGDYAVLGRYQTDHVHGVPANNIKDGVIYLAEPVYPHRAVGNVYVYDFGYRDVHHHHDHGHLAKKYIVPEGGSGGENGGDTEPPSNPDAPNNGCVANHGGINCSDKYNIHEGRCPEVKSTCMDYNGWFTDCNKAHRMEYFLGSDCSVSVARGNCWNEMESIEESA